MRGGSSPPIRTTSAKKCHLWVAFLLVEIPEDTELVETEFAEAKGPFGALNIYDSDERTRTESENVVLLSYSIFPG